MAPSLPVAKLSAQLIAEVKPKLVITMGTAGGIGPAIELRRRSGGTVGAVRLHYRQVLA